MDFATPLHQAGKRATLSVIVAMVRAGQFDHSWQAS
jgi:hypothetical protein